MLHFLFCPWQSGPLVCSVAISKYYRMSGFENKHLFSLNAKSWKCMIQMPENQFPCSFKATSSHFLQLLGHWCSRSQVCLVFSTVECFRFSCRAPILFVFFSLQPSYWLLLQCEQKMLCCSLFIAPLIYKLKFLLDCVYYLWV